MSAFLEVRGLTVAVDSRVVVKKANLEAECGSVSVILGPNGAGKSSLLAAIAGLPRYRVLNGEVRVGGRSILGMKCWERAAKGIVLAHQIPPASKYVRGIELVKWMCSRYGWSLKEAMELASKLRVEGLLDRLLFRGLSGGERKRLELYLAMLQKPRVALLDEPDSGVDIDSLNIISKAIEELAGMESAVVLVSHTLNLLRKLLDKGVVEKAYVLVNGEVKGSGEPRYILSIVEKEGFRVRWG